MKFTAIIPARYESTRFPGKPLALINGKPMIRWVYENARKCLDNVWVATDDERIMNAVTEFGGNAIKTLPTHKSGTDRCAEAALLISVNKKNDIIINIQGDEPFIQPGQIRKLMDCFDDQTEIATLIRKIESKDELFNPNRPKVVTGANMEALYFSRSPIPFLRGVDEKNWTEQHKYWAHIGMYAYRADVLQQITKLSSGLLEQAESLEQLRWLENGYKIKTAETTYESMGIDTPEDLREAVLWLNSIQKT